MTCWSFQEPYAFDVPGVATFEPTINFGGGGYIAQHVKAKNWNGTGGLEFLSAVRCGLHARNDVIRRVVFPGECEMESRRGVTYLAVRFD